MSCWRRSLLCPTRRAGASAPRLFLAGSEHYPFDIVGLANLSEAFAIAKACLKLLGADYPDEAYGLSRSLVEVATNLRYLTVDSAEQERSTRAFLKFAMEDKAFWYHYALESAKNQKEKAALRAYAKQCGIVDNTKPPGRMQGRAQETS